MTVQKRYAKVVRRRVGEMLLKHPETCQKVIAECLEISPRTLNSWKRKAKAGWQKQAKKKSLDFFEVLMIAKEWKRQGYPGSRPVIKALPDVRVRLVRSVVGDLKIRKSKRRAMIRKKVQVRVRIKKPGVVVTVDGATLKKGEDHIVYRDRGSLSVQSQKCENGSLAAKDTLNVLTNLKNKDRLPVVFCSDNGSPLVAGVVGNFLDKNYIIHLKSLPRVPQHNGSCENAVKEFKELINEGYSPEKATEILNVRRKRRQLGYKTSLEFDEENFKRYTDEERKRFYDAAKTAINAAVIGTKSGYEKRKAEREAIFQTLERFGLITRTRGGLSCSPKPEETL